MATEATGCRVHGYFCRRRGLQQGDAVERLTASQSQARRPMRAAARAACYVFVGSLAIGALVASLQLWGSGAWGAWLVTLLAPSAFAGFLAYAASLRIARLGAQVGGDGQMGMYELESRIAQGGMGEVWRARHQMLSRPAAVKLIRPHVDGAGTPKLDEVALRRFEREAQVTASLKSAHTVHLYDFGVTQSGTFYYVMELLDGMNLEKLVADEGPLEPERVVRIMTQVLDSLAEAHAHGLVHRDIKPANINIARRGLTDDFVTVLDFGLVKTPGRPGDAALTLTAANHITGTPAYLAPEMITGEAPIDGRTDLYSLGCVAYFLLTGKLVFEAQSPMQMAILHASERPLPPSQRAERPIPKALDALVMKCLEKRPEDRPESAVALLALLKSLDLGDAASERALGSSPSRTRNLVN